MPQPEHRVGQRQGPGLAASRRNLSSLWRRRFSFDSFLAVSRMLSARSFSRSSFPWNSPTALAPLAQILAEPLVLRAQRPDGARMLQRTLRVGAPPGGGFRCRQSLPQPGDLVAQRRDLAVFTRTGGFPEELPQAHDFRLQGRRVLHGAAEFLRLLGGLAQPAPAGLEPPLPHTGIATGGHLRPAQFFAARLRRLGSCPFLFVQGLQIPRLTRGLRLRRRPDPVAALGQCLVCGEIVVENRHALKDSADRIVCTRPSLHTFSSAWIMTLRTPDSTACPNAYLKS